MKRTGPPYRGVRAWVLSLVGVIVLGAGWLAVSLLVSEHDVVASVTVVLLSASILAGNCRGARTMTDPGRTRRFRDAQPSVPEERAARRPVSEIRLGDDVEPPRPKLGAPGSPN